MKQIKLFSLVALVSSLTVTAAFADTGKMSSSAVSNMCERQAAELIKHQDSLASAPAAHESVAPVKEEPTSGTVNAM